MHVCALVTPLPGRVALRSELGGPGCLGKVPSPFRSTPVRLDRHSGCECVFCHPCFAPPTVVCPNQLHLPALPFPHLFIGRQLVGRACPKNLPRQQASNAVLPRRPGAPSLAPLAPTPSDPFYLNPLFTRPTPAPFLPTAHRRIPHYSLVILVRLTAEDKPSDVISGHFGCQGEGGCFASRFGKHLTT